MLVNEFIKKMDQVCSKLQTGEILVLFGAGLQVRNRDVEYKFRQDSDFYYLTGFAEPDAVLLLTRTKRWMFVLPKDKEKEIWTGIRTGKHKIKKDLKLSDAFDNTEWQQKKSGLFAGNHTIYHFFGKNTKQDLEIVQITQQLEQARDGKNSPHTICKPLFLHEMRMIKSATDIQKIAQAAEITNQGHRALMQHIRAGMFEYEAEAILEKEYLCRGAWGGGYGHIVASAANATILHYTVNNRKMQTGDLVLVDSGAEKDYYTADVTRTFPVGKTFTTAQKEIYSIVLAAQKQAIAMCKPGMEFQKIHENTVEFLVTQLIQLKLLHGSLKQNIRNKTYTRFYMHKTGHWLGMDVHDVGSYFEKGKSRKLKNGMVLTIEPGLYFDPADKEIPDKYRGIGIRIEDNILVNGKNPVNLTRSIPKEIEEIEKLKASLSS